MGLLNVDGYYSSLLSFIDKAVEEGFISPNARQIIISAPTAKELVKKLEVTCHLMDSKRKKLVSEFLQIEKHKNLLLVSLFAGIFTLS